MNDSSQTLSDLRRDLRIFVVDTFLFGADHGFADGTSFLADGIVDSTGVLELIAHLERVYGIKLEDDELLPGNLDSINAIASFLTRKRGIG